MSDAMKAGPNLFDDDSFFLSKTNPTATTDQREMEREALSLMGHELIVGARANAFGRFKVMASEHGAHAPDEAFEGIEAKMDEWAFHYLLLGLNHDPNHPKVLNHGYGPPHKWLDMDVIGCRGLGTAENPDNNYCFIPIGYGIRYELHGKISEVAPIEDVNFWLTSNLSMSSNVHGLMWDDVEKNPDGTFVITIDSEPANGRPNHIRSTPDTQRLFIRDSRKDWDEIPNAYRIFRVGEPSAPPVDLEAKIWMARRFIIDDMATNFWFRMMVGYLDSNTITGPDNTGEIGGMITQKILRGRVDLNDDEAFVLTTHPGGSDYWNIVAYDWWLMSMNFWDHTSSLNNHQSIANDDGSYTHVFSMTDPGVHNWIDLEGLHHTLFLLRWQGLPQVEGSGAEDRWIASGSPTASCEVVKLSELQDALPGETCWVTAEERREQIASRLAQFNRRHAI